MLAGNQAARALQGVRVARRGEVLPPRLLREPPAGRRLTVAYDAARNTGLAQHAQTVQLAGRLDDAGQHQLAEHLVPAHGLLEPEHPVGMD